MDKDKGVENKLRNNIYKIIMIEMTWMEAMYFTA